MIRMKKLKFLSLMIIMLFSACIFNREYITDYSEKMQIAKRHFPEIYQLYQQGSLVIESIYLDKDTNKYHISYRYR